MNRNTLNYVVDGVLALLGLAVAATGLLIGFVMPPQTGAKGLTLLGLTRHGWGSLHTWMGVAIVLLVLLHLALHWNWVCATTRRLALGTGAGALSPSRRRGYGVVALVLLAAGFVGGYFAAQAAMRAPATADASTPATSNAETPGHHGDPLATSLRGSMTFGELCDYLHAEPAQVRARLGITTAIDRDRTLGDIARQQGKTMAWLRLRIQTMAIEPAHSQD
ncbi:MAG: DUF4405 domain-containing protein [Planctomycetota bacterium]